MNNFLCEIKDFSDYEYKCCYNSMSESRKNKVDRLRNVEDKKSTILGEMLVKNHFGWDSVIEYDEKGKPYLKNKEGFFSISHSKGLVLVSVSQTPVGVDLEKIRPVNFRIIKKVCNDKEKEYILNGKDENEKKLRLLEIWTFKEAYFKYLGTGITNFLSVDYFDDKIKRKKEITNEYVMHIVY